MVEQRRVGIQEWSTEPLFKPLFTLRRGGIAEVTVFGEIVCVSSHGVVFQTSQRVGQYPARSLLKPFQVLAAGWPARGLELRHIAAVGSYSATQEQVIVVQSWLKQSLWADVVQHLKLPGAYPLDEVHRVELIRRGEPKKCIYHTCFCKHAAILESCAVQKWPFENYVSKEHPFHDALKAELEKLTKKTDFQFVIDGCGLPTPVLSLLDLAWLYYQLVNSAQGSDLLKLALAMQKYRDWIGGPQRLDTRVMGLSQDFIVAKEGADGLFALGLKRRDSSDGFGIVLKLSSGFQANFVNLALQPICSQLLIPIERSPLHGQTIEYHFDPVL